MFSAEDDVAFVGVIVEAQLQRHDYDERQFERLYWNSIKFCIVQRKNRSTILFDLPETFDGKPVLSSVKRAVFRRLYDLFHNLADIYAVVTDMSTEIIRATVGGDQEPGQYSYYNISSPVGPTNTEYSLQRLLSGIAGSIQPAPFCYFGLKFFGRESDVFIFPNRGGIPPGKVEELVK